MSPRLPRIPSRSLTYICCKLVLFSSLEVHFWSVSGSASCLRISTFLCSFSLFVWHCAYAALITASYPFFLPPVRPNYFHRSEREETVSTIIAGGQQQHYPGAERLCYRFLRLRSDHLRNRSRHHRFHWAFPQNQLSHRSRLDPGRSALNTPAWAPLCSSPSRPGIVTRSPSSASPRHSYRPQTKTPSLDSS